MNAEILIPNGVNAYPNGWNKLSNGNILFKNGGDSQIYNESGLRHSLRGFLTNESRERYGDDKFLDYNEYYKSLEWFMDGLKLFKK